jgi:hypothetical protein
MDDGRLAEYDAPLTLFDSSGIFRGMCDRSGITREHIVAQSRTLVDL